MVLPYAPHEKQKSRTYASVKGHQYADVHGFGFCGRAFPTGHAVAHLCGVSLLRAPILDNRHFS